LLSLIEAPKDNHEKLSGKGDWLLDSGGSYYITGNINLVTNLCNIPLIPVTMINDTIAFASKRGSVKLNDNLVLYVVQYVPSLNCNLISVAQLIEDLCFSVTFTHKLCVIEDLLRRRRLDQVSIEGGLLLQRKSKDSSKQSGRS